MDSWKDETNSVNYSEKYENSNAAEKFFIKLWNVTKSEPFPVVLIVAAALAIWFPFILICFHIYLVFTGQTTNEKLKNAFQWGMLFFLNYLFIYLFIYFILFLI